jgi:hypothetical protein
VASRAWRRILALLTTFLLLAGVAALTTTGDDDSGVVTAAAPRRSTTTSSSTSTTVEATTTTAAVAAPATTKAPARPRTTSAPRTATTRRAPAPAPTPSNTGLVAAFYYGWYPSSFGFPGSRFHPTAGHYDSKDINTVRRQIDQMRYGGIQAGIASWWGPGHSTDQAFPVGLAASEGTPFKWSIYYEPEGPGHANQSPDQLRASLQYLADRYFNHPNYLRIDGKPVVFVWPDPNDRCDMVTRWNQANTLGLHIVQKRFPGYASCGDQPNSWHDYSPDRYQIEVKPWSFSVGPGFYRYDEAPRLARDPAKFEAAVRAMAASTAMWKLVTTFNEWGEGTAIEPAQEWASPSGYGVYLDIMHGVLGSR